MKLNKNNQIHPDLEKEIENSLLEGMVSRAATYFFVGAFANFLYSFLSLDLFRKIHPDLTLWENTWPRIIVSAAGLSVAFFFKTQNLNLKLKAYLINIIIPLFTIGASCVYAWPAFWEGHYDFYLWFHATNIIAMCCGIAVIAASPYMALVLCGSYFVIYFGPLIYLFSTHGRFDLAELIASDTLLTTIILHVALRSIHKLRMQVLTQEHQKWKRATSFLGKSLSKVITETEENAFQGYIQKGLIMAVDLRGYTHFFQTTDQNSMKQFMMEYHSVIAEKVHGHRGYLHKTTGDGLLISFGIMERDEDLSDLTGLDDELQKAEFVRKEGLLQDSYALFLDLAGALEQLREKYKIEAPLLLGSGCSFGNVEVVIRGNKDYRQELDIDGAPIIRAVRLEAFTKSLNQGLETDSSFFILDTELVDAIESHKDFRILDISTLKLQVRDFPDIKVIGYRQWKHRRPRNQSKAAA